MHRLYLIGLLVLTMAAVAALSRGGEIREGVPVWLVPVARTGLVALVVLLWTPWVRAEVRRG